MKALITRSSRSSPACLLLAGGWRAGLAGLLTVASAGGFSHAAQPLEGGSFSLVGTMAAGGAALGAGFAIDGRAAVAGTGTSVGAGFELTAGLFGVFSAPVGEVRLQMALPGPGGIRLSWPADATGYQLEFTPTVGPGAVWQAVQPVPEGNSYLTDPRHPTRYYRLRKP